MTTNSFISGLKNALKDAEDDAEGLERVLASLKEMTGLTIEGYEGDYPTFIEPVYVAPGVKIGDTVLLGPNVFIDEGCELGDFTELSNVLLKKNVKTGKLTKLNNCIVEEEVELPREFKKSNCFIKSKGGELEIIDLP